MKRKRGNGKSENSLMRSLPSQSEIAGDVKKKATGRRAGRHNVETKLKGLAQPPSKREFKIVKEVVRGSL